jgi:hypothetical protein
MKVRQFYLFACAATLLLLVTAIRELDDQARPPPQKGVAYAAWWPGAYSHPDADLALADLKATGANWIALVVTGYQDTITSTTVYTNATTPTDADLTHVIAQAHALELNVMLRPGLTLFDDPTHWHGQIGEAFTTEAEWEAWFASYRSFISHYADLAETCGADQFSIGGELTATTHRADDWRTVIAGVRARYSGPITYSADWGGEETNITWWDGVDYIGVDPYYPLTDKNDPTLDELKAAWAPHVAVLASLSSNWERPVIFTEIGYRSVDGSNRRPWDFNVSGPVDLQEQADAYQATFESVYDQPWLAGMFWWAWTTDPFQGGPCDDSYTPHDKPAEDVLRAWYGAPPRPTPTPTPHPDYSRTMDMYADGLGSGWQDWSWDATCNLAAIDQVYSGTRAISLTLRAWGALYLHADPVFDSGPYHWLEFYVRGSPSGEQHLWAFLFDDHDDDLRKRPVDDCRYIEGGSIEAGTWKRVWIPLSDLDAAGQFLGGIAIQDRSGQAFTACWVDEIRLVGATWPMYLPVVVNGPLAGLVNMPYNFTATVRPVTATQPITYLWQSTGLGTLTHTGGDLDDSATFAWTMPGPKIITVTASNAASMVRGTHAVTINVVPDSVSISGPTTGLIRTTYLFTAAVSPPTATHPITYVWRPTQLAPITHTGADLADTATLTWITLGPKVITVTAANATRSVASMPYTVTIVGSTSDNRVYLPIVLRQLCNREVEVTPMSSNSVARK